MNYRSICIFIYLNDLVIHTTINAANAKAKTFVSMKPITVIIPNIWVRIGLDRS